MHRTALAVAVLCAWLPSTLVAQDREARLEAVVKEGRNLCSRMPYMEEFRSVERQVGDLYASRNFAYPTNAGEDVALLPSGEAVLEAYSRDEIGALLTSMAVYRDCTFFFRDRFSFAIRLYRADGSLFARADANGKLTLVGTARCCCERCSARTAS